MKKKLSALKRFVGGIPCEINSIEDDPEHKQMIAKCTIWKPGRNKLKDACILGPDKNNPFSKNKKGD